MIAYLDASVMLRIVLGQPAALTDWRRIQRAISSTLSEVECLRTLDRLRFTTGRFTEEQLASWRASVYRLLRITDLVDLAPAVLQRAAQPFAIPLGTLDALHLATALLWQDDEGEDLLFATHDAALGRAARAHGFEVLGL